MNAIQFFQWGMDDKRAKEKRMKEESDKIHNELLNNPMNKTFYYRKGEYWYKYTYPQDYNRTVYSWEDIGAIEIDELVPYFTFSSILYLNNCDAKIIVLKYVLEYISYNISMRPTNNRVEKIIVTNKFGKSISYSEGYIFFNVENKIGKTVYIECDREKTETLKNKIVIE